MRILLMTLSAMVLSSCATTTSSNISESNGQVVLADSHIGEHYDVVMTRAATNYAVEPQCEQRKVALKKQRKAFLYEICGFNPESQRFSDAPLSEVVYHFIGGELVRVDVRAAGQTELLDNVKEDMSAIFGSNNSVQSTLGQDSYQWNAKQHVAGVRAGAGASAGNVHVRLLGEDLVDNAPWLADE